MSVPLLVPREVDVRTLVEQVYETLRARILWSQLAPGEKLEMSELARAFGVSVTPVRDAINLLAADGLVVVTPRRGTAVATFTAADTEELYQLRLMLEPTATEAAAKNLTDEELAMLAELLAPLEPSPDVYLDAEAYVQDITLDGEFHSAIMRGARNTLLDNVYKNLHAHMIVARSVFPTTYRNTERRKGEHERILEALLARDGARSRAAMELHLRMALDDVTRHFQENQRIRCYKCQSTS